MDETPESYGEHLQHWLDTLSPSSPALVSLAHRIADVDFRTQRLARMEQKAMADALAGKVEKTVAHKTLVFAKNAMEGVEGLRVLAEGVTAEMSIERAQGLIAPMQSVVEMCKMADVPGSLLGPLGVAVEEFVLDSVVEILPESFTRIARACRDVGTHLVEKIPELEGKVEQERERIGRTLLLSDSKELRLLDRHRGRLGKEMNLALNAYERTLALSQVAQGSPGSSVVPSVELRVVQTGR